MQLRRIHHVELWVGNARQSAYFYEHAFGFRSFAYSGLETGQRRATSFAVEQGKARLMLTAPLLSDSAQAEHIRKHGDGVRDIAFEVDDADAAFAEAVAKGAEPVEPPHDLADTCGTMRHAAIRAYGDTIHSFLSNVNYRGPFLPGFTSGPGFTTAQPSSGNGHDAGILRIDHIVGNVELGKMTEWAAWYSRVLGFERYMSFDDKDISTEFSALMSVVMSDDSHSVKFPINEPAAGRRKSQIQEYLDYNNGPGVQHIALQTRDIIHTVGTLRANGVEFLYVPDTYYASLADRVGAIDEDLDQIRKLGILVDRDHEGYLLQIFTRPVEDRPTLFFEIIERHGSRGFGKGNFRALFEAIEAEQARRGNL